MLETALKIIQGEKTASMVEGVKTSGFLI